MSQLEKEHFPAQPLKFAYYEHLIATPPMRQSRRASYANRLLVLLITIASLLLFFYPRLTTKFSAADKECIQDEWIDNPNCNSTKDLGSQYRISFADNQQEFHWIHLPVPPKNHEILMIINSNCDNFGRRNAIRKTWMSAEKNRIVADGRLKALFLVGVKNPMVDEVVIKEAKMFGDMIVVDLKDTYEMLTFKSFTALLYALNKDSSAELIGKIDEDVMFFPDQLLPFLEKGQISYNSSSVYGSRYEPGIVVSHEPGNKWYIPPSSFKCSVFPSYVAGPLYFVTRKAAQRIVNATCHRKFISVEDVFITGLLAGDVGVEKKHLPMIFHLTASNPDTLKLEIMGWHKLKSNSQYEEEFDALRASHCAPCMKSE